jgi:WD40 repeat protein
MAVNRSFRRFSPSRDGTATLWSRDGQPLQQFEHDSAVYSVAWSDDGREILTGSSDGTATIYPVLTLDELIDAACARLSGFLRHNPTVTDRQRAACDIPPRDEPSVESSSPRSLTGWRAAVRRWLPHN